MRVIVLATQKGGAGKSTLCGHLGVQAEIFGDGPVAFIDADPQSSLADWWNDRKADTPILVQISSRGLKETLDLLEGQGFNTVIIDTPGRADEAIGDIIRLADLVLVPLNPSPLDLRAVGPTIEMVEKQGVRMVFVINAAGTGRLTKEVAVALSQHGTVAPVICRNRQDFKASMVKGLTAMETTPEGKSAGEVAELWAYVRSISEKEKSRGRKTSR